MIRNILNGPDAFLQFGWSLITEEVMKNGKSVRIPHSVRDVQQSIKYITRSFLLGETYAAIVLAALHRGHWPCFRGTEHTMLYWSIQAAFHENHGPDALKVGCLSEKTLPLMASKWFKAAGRLGVTQAKERNQMLHEADDKCAACHCSHGKERRLKTCSKCKLVVYCNATCQARHWDSTHRAECPLFQELAAVASSIGREDQVFLIPKWLQRETLTPEAHAVTPKGECIVIESTS